MTRKKWGSFSKTLISHGGETKPLHEWAEIFGIPYATVRMRYTRGKRDFHELFDVTGVNTHAPYDRAGDTVKKQNLYKRVEILESRVETLKQAFGQLLNKLEGRE